MDLLRDELAGPGGPLDLDDAGWPLRTAATLQLPARSRARPGSTRARVAGACVAGTVERAVLGPGVIVEEGRRCATACSCTR
jgi:ADP-glucose pyrophosphorylase